MEALLALLLFAAAVYGLWRNLAALVDAWRADRPAFVQSMKLIGYYFLYCGLGLAIVVGTLDGPQPESRALGGTLFLLAWIFYGALWLARTAPRTQPIPGWIERYPGPADAVLVTAAVAGAVLYFA